MVVLPTVLGRCVCAVAVVALVHSASTQAQTRESRPGVDKRAERAEELARQYERDAHAISVEDVNRFHYALVHRVMLRLPRELGLRLQYTGLVAIDNGVQAGQRVLDSAGNPLEWSLYPEGGLVTFSLWMTTRKTDEAVASIRIGKTTYYVEVLFVDGHAEVDATALDAKMDALGGRAVRQVLKLLETPPEPTPQ